MSVLHVSMTLLDSEVGKGPFLAYSLELVLLSWVSIRAVKGWGMECTQG